MAVGVIVIAGGLTWGLLQKGDDSVKAGTATAVVTTPVNSQSTTQTNQTGSKLSQREQERVDRLLEVAQAHFMVGRLVSPQGSNALDAYRLVLDTDPENLKAKAGIAEVKDRFFKRARILWMQGEKEEARQHLALSNQIFAGEPEVAELQQLMQ